MSKVSIVLPSYNRSVYLAKSIESCLNQTFTDFELIIVDDCSKDDSLMVARSYAEKDSRVKVIANKVNQKLPSVLNLGFKKAVGEYFTWISDDNLFHPNALEEMVNYLDSAPDVGLVYTDYTLIDERGIIGSRICQEPPDFLPIRDCVGACFLYRAWIANEIGGYNPDLILVEDYDYWLRIGLKAKLSHIPKSLYYYRKHTQSLTAIRKEEIQKAKLNLKKIYSSKYQIPEKYKPINDLYMWFIQEKNLFSWFKLIKIIISSPILTLNYIICNFRRLR